MDMYLLLSFASGVAITTLAFILLLVRIEPDEESRKIRFARAILAASYFLLAVPDWLNIYGLNDSEDIAAATIVSASIQSLLFTFTLITMIRPSLVTMRRILINVALVAVGSLCFLVVDSLAGSPIVGYSGGRRCHCPAYPLLGVVPKMLQKVRQAGQRLL